MPQRALKRIDGRWAKQVHQSEAEVQSVLDLNHFISTSASKPGGVGSDNMRFLARVPTAAWGQWAHDWRMRGGLTGTGMKMHEYIVLQASLPDYSKFVTTPSGKTGFERKARLLRKWGARDLRLDEVSKRPSTKRGVTFRKGDTLPPSVRVDW